MRSEGIEASGLSSAPISDATLDPEADGFDALGNNADGSEEDIEEEARNHARHTYAEMAPSKLRKRANHLEGLDAHQMEKYKGVKSTRKEMMSDIDGERSSADDNEGDEAGDSSDNGRGGGKGDSVGDGEETTSGTIPEKETRVRFEDGQEQSSASRLNAAQSDAQMLQELRKRSREDAERGRDARTQMDLWSRLLGSRIRGQKVVRVAGRIPSKAIRESLPGMQDVDRQAYNSTLLALDELSSHLFLLQQNILQSFTGSGSSERDLVMAGLSTLQAQFDEVSKIEASSKKHIDALFRLDETIFEPLWRGVLARWSSRTSVTSLEGGQRNKFESSLKAMNQSAEDQIDRGLTGDTFDRLRKRTRVWRGTEQEGRLHGTEDMAAGEDESGSENAKKEEEADVFDDSDFYQAMLRELIDSRGGTLTMGADTADSSLAWAQAAKRAAKKNKNTDLRSSKGRKLRYDVLEKVEHFMPPVPRETWSQDQVDRLFRQLKQSSSQSGVESEKEGNGVAEGDKVGLAGLRLFG